MKDFLTVKEAGEFLGVSERSVFRAMDAGRLKGQKVGGAWHLEKASVAQLFLSREPSASALAATTTDLAKSRGDVVAPKPDVNSLMEYMKKGIALYAVVGAANARSPYRAWRLGKDRYTGRVVAQEEAVVKNRSDLLCAIARGTKAFAFCPVEHGMTCVRVSKSAMSLLKNFLAQEDCSLPKKLYKSSVVSALDGETDFYFYCNDCWIEHAEWRRLGVRVVGRHLKDARRDGLRLAVAAGSVTDSGLWIFERPLSECTKLPCQLKGVLVSPTAERAAAELVL